MNPSVERRLRLLESAQPSHSAQSVPLWLLFELQTIRRLLMILVRRSRPRDNQAVTLNATIGPAVEIPSNPRPIQPPKEPSP